MSNDNDDLPSLPTAPETDENLTRASAQVANLDDDAAARKIRTRTSMVGRVMGVVLVGGGLGLGYFAYDRHVANENRWDAYNAAAADESISDEEFCRRIREEYARTTFPDVRRHILSQLAERRDVASVPLFISALSDSGVVRTEAARALARIGSPAADTAKPALLAALTSGSQQRETSSRAAIAWALAVLGETSAADVIVEEFSEGRLQGQPGFDPRIIVRALGVGRLSQMTSNPSLAVRALVAQALSEAGTPDVIEPLSVLLRDDDDQVRRQAVQGLGRIGDPRAAGPLFEAMQSNPSMRIQVLDSLRRSTGARGLAVLLQSATDVETRRDLATMIRDTHDPAGADALASLLGEEDVSTKLIAASGLAEIADARGVPALLEIAQGSDLERARNALDMLALVQSPDVPRVLGPMISNPTFLARRAGAIKALGRSGSPDAGRILMRELEGDDAATAAMALAELDYEPAYTVLLRMAPRPANTPFNEHAGMAGVALETAYLNRTAAVRALGRYGRPGAADLLRAIVEDSLDDPRLRNDAGQALGAVADDAVLATVLDRILATDLDEAARRYYIGALWQHPSRAVASRLLDLMANTQISGDIRVPAAIAVGYTADPANDARLIQMLGSDDTALVAGVAITLGGSQEAARALLTRLGTDAELRTNLQDLLMNRSNNWFDVVTGALWDSGEVYRRVHVARILDEGAGDNRQGYAWQAFIARLQSGWGGHDGLSANQIRQRFYADLTAPENADREVVARILAGTQNLGLLMAARDANGPGAEEARSILIELNRPRTNDDDVQRALAGQR